MCVHRRFVEEPRSIVRNAPKRPVRSTCRASCPGWARSCLLAVQAQNQECSTASCMDGTAVVCVGRSPLDRPECAGHVAWIDAPARSVCPTAVRGSRCRPRRHGRRRFGSCGNTRHASPRNRRFADAHIARHRWEQHASKAAPRHTGGRRVATQDRAKGSSGKRIARYSSRQLVGAPQLRTGGVPHRRPRHCQRRWEELGYTRNRAHDGNEMVV